MRCGGRRKVQYKKQLPTAVPVFSFWVETEFIVPGPVWFTTAITRERKIKKGDSEGFTPFNYHQNTEPLLFYS